MLAVLTQADVFSASVISAVVGFALGVGLMICVMASLSKKG